MAILENLDDPTAQTSVNLLPDEQKLAVIADLKVAYRADVGHGDRPLAEELRSASGVDGRAVPAAGGLERRDGPIEIARAGQILIRHQVPAIIKRLQRQQSVGHIRVLIFAPVANTTIENVVDLSGFVEVDLRADEELSRLEQNGFVLRTICGEQGHH
jgi:hypothetical protein